MHRRDALRASKIMADRAMGNPKIRFAWNSAVEAIHGQDKVTGVTLRDTLTGEIRLLPASGVFVAVGHDPRNELIKGAIIISEPPKGHHVDSTDKTSWDQRYADSDLVWSAAPNIWVEQLTPDLPPGTALDIAAGEGRNALWLAARGWHATAVDFSVVALRRAASLAEEQLGRDAGRLVTLEVDVERWVPHARSYDLVLVVYLHLREKQRSAIMLSAAEAVAPGGTLLVVGNDLDNLTSGHGGPQTLACCTAPVTSWRTSSRHSCSWSAQRQPCGH